MHLQTPAPPPTSSPKHPHPPRTIPPPCIDLLCSSDIRSVTQSILLRERTLAEVPLRQALHSSCSGTYASAHITELETVTVALTADAATKHPRRAHPHHRRLSADVLKLGPMASASS
ncbi:hypothetical protein HGRIS_011950 [Hohenbuehelia grisea]|uniref:Uncharacterized protein n=1 Tax=Hohenbuehelia grisea TaxID=104357 RepID=A0ABR3JYY7_9AGAR